MPDGAGRVANDTSAAAAKAASLAARTDAGTAACDRDLATDADAVLVAERLTKRYFRASRSSARHFDAVSDVSVSLRAGELVCLMGRSGSGKTTLASIVAGLLPPTHGSVTACGERLYELDDSALSRLRNRAFGVVPQGQGALHALTVLENVTLPWRLYAREGNPEPRARELLARMGIAELADSYPAELSGGELRRMAVARALVTGPAVVVADEPTGDLDDENTATVLGLLRAAADEGAAVLVVTHEHGVEAFADRTWHMDAGVLS